MKKFSLIFDIQPETIKQCPLAATLKEHADSELVEGWHFTSEYCQRKGGDVQSVKMRNTAL